MSLQTLTPRGDAEVLRQYKDAILSAAARFHVDPVILGSIIMHESTGHPGVVSSKGASGLTQVLPSAHPEFSVAQLRGTDAQSIQYQIDAGAQVLKQAMDAHPGNMTAALQDYAGVGYQGPKGISFRDELIGGYTGPVSQVLAVNGGDFLRRLTGAVSPLNPYTGPLNPLSGGNPIQSTKDAAATAASAIGWFAQPDNMLRVLIGLAGIALIIGGLLTAASGNAQIREAATAAAAL
jgi:hypothetical protein